MNASREVPDRAHDAIERAVAWFVRQFEVTTSLLAAFAENDNRTDTEETGEHRTC